MESLTTSVARRADLPAVRRLYKELDASHGAIDGELARRTEVDRARHLEAALGDPYSLLLVARDGEDLLGFAAATFTKQGLGVVIEAILVAGSARRRGIGTRLMQAIEDWAAERRARFLELDVYEFNPEARAFYESLGYLTVRRNMRRKPHFDLSRFKGPV